MDVNYGIYQNPPTKQTQAMEILPLEKKQAEWQNLSLRTERRLWLPND